MFNSISDLVSLQCIKEQEPHLSKMRSGKETSSASASEDFTLVNATSHHKVFDDYEELFSAHLGNPDTSMRAALRRQYPELNVTVTTPYNGDCL